jgi:hypothetical protein
LAPALFHSGTQTAGPSLCRGSASQHFHSPMWNLKFY